MPPPSVPGIRDGHQTHDFGPMTLPNEHHQTQTMKLRTSRILRELRAGQNPGTLKMNLNDPRLVELAGLARAAGVWLCNEHVPNDWVNLENQGRAARLHDMDSIVRVCKGSYSDYVKPFEMDATGIMVPHVTTADEARKIVEMRPIVTTGDLVAAVKAAGLVDTLNGAGPFTVFAPTNAAFAKLPKRTVATLLKPENKATLTKVLT